jgi:hypothetical protein
LDLDRGFLDPILLRDALSIKKSQASKNSPTIKKQDNHNQKSNIFTTRTFRRVFGVIIILRPKRSFFGVETDDGGSDDALPKISLAGKLWLTSVCLSAPLAV